MPTPAKERVFRSTQARKAKGEQRLGGFLDAETAKMLEAYIKRHGLQKQEAVRVAIRRLVSEEIDTTDHQGKTAA